MKCPSLESLTDYADGHLTSAESARIADHLATGCATCVEYHEWYEKVRAITAADDSVAPPPWVMKRAVRIFETRQNRPRLVERIGNLVASLIFDSRALPSIAGVRSTETANRQLLYRAGDYSIDLQVGASQQSRCELIGQVLNESETAFDSVAGLKLELAGQEELRHKTVTDRMGEFRIADIRCGEYDLLIELPQGSITITGLPIIQS